MRPQAKAPFASSGLASTQTILPPGTPEESHGRPAGAIGQLAQRAVGLSQRPEDGNLRFRLVREPGGLLGGLPASEQNPPGSDVKDQPSARELAGASGAKPALCGVFGRDLRALLVRPRGNGGKLTVAELRPAIGRGGRSADTRWRIDERPHPARERGTGRCTDLVSSRRLRRTTEEGRWCLALILLGACRR